MSKHTDGPWLIDTANYHAGHIATVDHNGHVMEIWSETWPLPEDGPANAKLIAAAPALLTLAREYAGECAECGGSGEIVKNRGSGDPVDDYSVECSDCRDIRAVIDVATGR